MKLISLTHGKQAFVDDQDYGRLRKWKWFAQENRHKSWCIWYAARIERLPKNKRRKIYMHREIAAILGLSDVDHRDRNGLNNTRLNLRPASRSQNLGNQRKRHGCSSRFKGVHWKNHANKWAVNGPGRNGRFIGYFDSEKTAALAYNEAAIRAFGEFALVNVI